MSKFWQFKISLVENFAVLIFAKSARARKARKFAPCENFPLYGILFPYSIPSHSVPMLDTIIFYSHIPYHYLLFPRTISFPTLHTINFYSHAPFPFPRFIPFTSTPICTIPSYPIPNLQTIISHSHAPYHHIPFPRSIPSYPIPTLHTIISHSHAPYHHIPFPRSIPSYPIPTLHTIISHSHAPYHHIPFPISKPSYPIPNLHSVSTHRCLPQRVPVHPTATRRHCLQSLREGYPQTPLRRHGARGPRDTLVLLTQQQLHGHLQRGHRALD